MSVDAPRLGLEQDPTLDGAGDGAQQVTVLADTAGMPLAARLRPRDLCHFG